jgi:hypothetical protein
VYVGCDIESRYVNGLVVRVAEEVECEVEEAGEVVAFFDVIDVVVLDFEGLKVSVIDLKFGWENLLRARDGRRQEASSEDNPSTIVARCVRS